MVSQIKIPQKEEGYLIRSVDYGDDHRIVSFLTRQRGRLDTIALGAKKSLKRFGPALDFLNRLDLVFEPNPKGGLHRLLQVDLRNSHDAVRKDYIRTWTALEWCRLLSLALKEEGPVLGVFEILVQHLEALETLPPDWVDQAFQFQMLRTLGYALELSRCARCHGRPSETATFVPGEGGLLCGSCHVPHASELRAHFFTNQWWELSPDKAPPEAEGAEEREKVLAEALSFYLLIPKRGEKTTRNHSQRFRVVGRKVGGFKTKRTVKK